MFICWPLISEGIYRIAMQLSDVSKANFELG